MTSKTTLPEQKFKQIGFERVMIIKKKKKKKQSAQIRYAIVTVAIKQSVLSQLSNNGQAYFKLNISIQLDIGQIKLKIGIKNKKN